MAATMAPASLPWVTLALLYEVAHAVGRAQAEPRPRMASTCFPGAQATGQSPRPAHRTSPTRAARCATPCTVSASGSVGGRPAGWDVGQHTERAHGAPCHRQARHLLHDSAPLPPRKFAQISRSRRPEQGDPIASTEPGVGRRDVVGDDEVQPLPAAFLGVNHSPGLGQTPPPAAGLAAAPPRPPGPVVGNYVQRSPTLPSSPGCWRLGL